MRMIVFILIAYSFLYSGENFWDNLRSNYRQDGLAKCIGPRTPSFLWEYKFEAVGKENKENNVGKPYAVPFSSAVIAADSTLYAYNGGGILIAIKDDKVLWRETFGGGEYERNIAIDDEDILYFPILDNYTYYLVAYDPKQRYILWCSGLYGNYFVVLGPDDILYAGGNHTLSAYRKTDGAVLWGYSFSDGCSGWAYNNDRGLYYTSCSKAELIYTYSYREHRSIGDFYNPTPTSISNDGTIYFANRDKLYACIPGLYIKWSVSLGDTSTYQPCAVCPDGNIVIGTEAGYVYKIAKNSKILWKKYLSNALQWPTIDAEGKIFIGSYGFGMYCLSPEGDILYHIIPPQCGGQCLIGPGKRLYILDWDEVTCFNDKQGFNDEKISLKPLPTKFTIHPNPFRDRLSLELPSSGSVYSLTGQLIKTLSKGKHKIDTSSWKAGVYIIKCDKETKRIVKIE
jgi:hypothetical protein